MTAAANHELIQDLHGAYTSGDLDLEAILRPFNDQSVWIELGDNQRTAYCGATGLLEHSMRNLELTNGTLATEGQEIAGGEPYVVVVETRDCPAQCPIPGHAVRDRVSNG